MNLFRSHPNRSKDDEFVEDIVINYCNTRFGIDEEESKKLFYEISNEING